jgi:DNA-binding CsgD family transcriptional regulator
MYLLKPCKIWTGALHRPGGYGVRTIKCRKVYVHRKAWEDAHGAIPKGLRVLHHCDRPACYEEEHLFLGTQADNQHDMKQKDRQAKGSRHSQAKLTEAQVLAIRADLRGPAQLAAIYGVDPQTIKDVRTRTWRHI